MSATTAALAQLHRLNRAAARAGLVVRNCGAGGLVLAGPGWLAHSDDPTELLAALQRFSRPIQDRFKTDATSSTFFERDHHGFNRI